jgi:aryl-alcohol dehydrogenase-like predicted oxidoreductase
MKISRLLGEPICSTIENMKYRTLGRTGLKVSEIGFGAWAIGGSWGEQSEDDSLAALRKSLDLGLNFIDTAAGYGNGKSEQLIARVLKEHGNRDQVVVATKTPPAPGSWPPSPYCRAEERFGEKYLRENVEERLKNLDTDRIDVLQLHTWTRAWNENALPLQTLEKLRKEGKVRFFGLSTPEHDQNCVVELMQHGLLDVVQVIYNIFEQEPAAQLLPVAEKTKVGIIVRVAFDEGSLTGKFTTTTTFPEGDFRRGYFEGDRLARTVVRVEKIKTDLIGSGYTMPQAALKFVLAHPGVSTVIPGIRNISQAIANCQTSDLPEMPMKIVEKLRPHNWRRAFWYGGKA